MIKVADTIVAAGVPVLSGTGWSACARSPGAVTHPSQLADQLEWLPAQVPGTVAAALRQAGSWQECAPDDIDARDWWYQREFAVPAEHLGQPAVLRFHGLATLAEVWLNGESILTAENMFRQYRVDVTGRLRTRNELTLVFRSVTGELQRKRPRPKWKTNLVSHQQLRWVRVSLLGHIPGWSPPVPPIGPWGNIDLEFGPELVTSLQLRTHLDGADGIVTIRAGLHESVNRAELLVGDQRFLLDVTASEHSAELRGELRIPGVPVWWPHTHGEPRLVSCRLFLARGDRVDQIDCGEIGFRNLGVEADDGGFAVHLNGVPVFCRGACWTVNDIFTLTGRRDMLEHDLRLAQDAGINMLRVGGTMVYESDDFYRLCDKLGILVWQDFMFANMDYPVGDPTFRENIRCEAEQQLTRWSAHPCLAVYCGSSETEQQAAMLGLPRESWSNAWFAEELPALCAERHPGTVYVPSTPTGGSLPFQPDVGLTHYYGVGAYRRPLTDVRRSDVRFTPECLGFSHLPEPSTLAKITAHGALVPHAPEWKRRIPRDTGAGWDFEDIRDHYLAELYGVDPVALRARDLPRYLQLGRQATAEILGQVFSEWRSCHSRAAGALVWFYKDLWPGAGWGLVDSEGLPKAAYYALRRVWSARQVTITGEGLNGLHLHLTNETAAEISGSLEIELLREPETVIAREACQIRVPGRARVKKDANELLGRFCDVSYAYQFGPPAHDTVIATWRDEHGALLSDAVHRITTGEPARQSGVPVEVLVRRVADHRVLVELNSPVMLHGVRLAAPGYLPDDNYFPLPPRREKRVEFRALDDRPARFELEWGSLNLQETGYVTADAALT